LLPRGLRFWRAGFLLIFGVEMARMKLNG
jgi:hypothetical protein